MQVEAIYFRHDLGEAIYLPYNTVFLTLKSSMVICTLYVHITIAKFSTLFRHKNSMAKGLNCSKNTREDF